MRMCVSEWVGCECEYMFKTTKSKIAISLFMWKKSISPCDYQINKHYAISSDIDTAKVRNNFFFN